MKHLVAVLFAILIALIPLAASATTLTWNVNLSTEFNEGGQFDVKVDTFSAIPDTDQQSYELNTLTGYVDQNHIGPLVASGLYANWSGITAYFYISTSSGWSCGPGATLLSNGHGCLLTIPYLTPGHDQVVTIEDDFNANEWIYWILDEHDVAYELASYATTVDWFTVPTLQTALVYPSLNPKYVLGTMWLHPQGFSLSLGPPYHFDFASAVVSMHPTSPQDANVCTNGVYGFAYWVDQHTVFAGSPVAPGQTLVCNGQVWPR